METRETILKELESISTAVANLGNANVFKVPQGYFEQFPAAVLAQVKAESIDFGRSEPFSVPAGYFDSLASNIISRVKNQELSVKEELDELAPVLNSINKQPVYAVPEGYFESLELTIPLKLDKPSARVFSFGKTKRVLQYAVAACTAGVLILGAYLFTNKDPELKPAISHVEAVKMNVSSELDKLSETDIASYIDETPTIGYALNVSDEEIDFDEYLDAASDEEIDQYLNETADPGQTAEVGS